MKSEKAKEAIERYRQVFSAPYEADETAEYCRLFKEIAEIAEQEAEDRMREKAIEAHRACCPLNELQCIHRDRDDYTCTYDCRYVTSFIQKMTEQ